MQFRLRMEKKVSVVLATYNEKDNIKVVIEGLIKHVDGLFEVIVVDDNSPDGTWKIVQEMGKKDKRIRCIHRVHERGLGSAIARGVAESKGNCIGWMDADTAHPPETMGKMVDALSDYDVAMGSRYVPGGGDDRSSLRIVTSKMLNYYTGAVLGSFKVHDWHTGFIVGHRRVFDKITLMDTGYAMYCIKFLRDCVRARFTIKEIPFINRERTLGESKSIAGTMDLFKHGINYGIDIIKLRFSK